METHAPHKIKEVELSSATREALENLRGKYEITTFSAKWCTNCPYAKKVVAAFCKAAPDHLSYKVVDVDREKVDYSVWPILKRGRVLLPAVGVPTDGKARVLFTTRDLERRLLELLRGLDSEAGE